jgi:hypothetical protein
MWALSPRRRASRSPTRRVLLAGQDKIPTSGGQFPSGSLKTCCRLLRSTRTASTGSTQQRTHGQTVRPSLQSQSRQRRARRTLGGWAETDPLHAAFSRHPATRQNSGEAKMSASFHRLLLPASPPPTIKPVPYSLEDRKLADTNPSALPLL